MKPYCYKCLSEEELSIKKRNKDGSIGLHICRSCRRAEYNKYKPTVETLSTNFNVESWTKYATEVNSKLAKKYAKAR